MHGHEPKGVDCPAIDGIIKEANEIAGDIADKQMLDAALIAAAQAVEHYEITRYGTLIAWAKQLGRADCASVLAAEPRRREGDRREADQTGDVSGQPESRVKARSEDEAIRWGSRAHEADGRANARPFSFACGDDGVGGLEAAEKRAMRRGEEIERAGFAGKEDAVFDRGAELLARAALARHGVGIGAAREWIGAPSGACRSA